MTNQLKQTYYFVLLACVFALGIYLQGAGTIDDFLYYQEDIVYLTVQHIELVLLSGGLAILIAIPVGVLLSRPRFQKVAESAMQVLNVGTTIPTLAILALAMSFLGIGTVPAVFGLTIASLLPIVRNTYIGLKEVPAHLKEAASGIGMTELQMLFQVEIPNALFVIFAGIRTALAVNVGTVPLAFLIGGGGLGELIFTGIDLDEPIMMLAGAIPTAMLAIAIDSVVGAVSYVTVPKGCNPIRARQ
ncbi:MULTISPECIES: ABC transporter permease [Vibrio]|uniref:ABC-type proline/glycine betaine transport systems, permease component n=2 Tax=Vibrio antiquarius (strain Ex25) TaxID=150340 RepID=A0ABM9WUB9_VIBAE|nr:MULTISPECIES: ABC transporter permease [Vibrio]MCF7453232.1 ABC transporter permease [Vibrio sp. A1-1]MCK8062657.1 ABC transporter permease [Vibrio sp. 1CM7H]MEA3481048.1 ABC transporter permease [Pseudomonadota bacterium]NAW83071.1 ABC transporter permease subunit [Vibrio sp. V43_P6S15P86]QCO87753.1 ABC transporter permease [Vibrio neocaledonicus]RCW25622.1 osmoprotectant transport system permease protein [Vibrio parahaemolyticus]